MIVFLVAAAHAQSACSADPSADVDHAVQSVEESFRRVDEVSFDQASKALYAAISCLDRAPAPSQVVDIHRAMALASFVNGQIRACRQSLAATRLLDPAWQLEDSMFPASHPYRDLFAQATNPGAVKVIGKITPQVWIVDGVVRDEAPVERAFLLQVAEGGKITWSGYLWDWEEIPDRGQAQVRSVLESPHDVWLAARVHGGGLFSDQLTAPGASAWDDAHASTFAGGADLVLRYTPITVVGGELSGTMVGPADSVDGGGGLPSGRAVLLLGGAGWIHATQPFAAARIGGGVDRIRAWTFAEEGTQPEIYTVGSLVAGAEFGLRTNRERLQGTVDAQIARQWTPYAWQAQVDGGALVSGPLALEGMLGFRRGGLPFVQPKDPNSELPPSVTDIPVGKRRDTEFRIGGGVALWY